MVTALTRGRRDVGGIAKTAATVVSVFGRNLVPGGKRTTLYSIQTLARKHPAWYRQDLEVLLAMLADGRIAPVIAAIWTLDDVPAAAAGLAQGAMPGKQIIESAGRAGTRT